MVTAVLADMVGWSFFCGETPVKIWCNVLLSTTLVLACFANSASVVAQEKKVPLAQIAFELSPQEILDSPFGQSLGLRNTMGPGRNGPDQLVLNAESVRGVVAMPKTVDGFAEALQTGRPFPIEFYIEIKVKDAAAFEAVENQIAEMSELREEKGVRIYPVSEDTGFYTAFDKDQTVVVASVGYDYSAKNLEKITKSAERMWGKPSKAAMRLVVDVDGMRDFVDSAVEFGDASLPPAAKSFLEIPQRLNSIQAKADVSGEQGVLKVVAECPSNSDATAVAEGVRALVGAGKMTLGTSAMDQMTVTMLDSIKPKVEGKTVSFSITQPKGMAEAAKAESERIILMNNHKQVILSMHNFESAYGRLPFAAAEGQSDKLSWRVRVLPFLEEVKLWKSFAIDEPWDSETNKRLVEFMPKLFGEGEKTGITWIKSEVNSFADITDGTSNTIALIENPNKVNWTEASDLTPDQALKVFLGLKDGETMIVTMYDGSVQVLSSSLDPEIFKGMLTPNGGEVFDFGG